MSSIFKNLVVSSIIFLISCSHDSSSGVEGKAINVVHFNIFELDSLKITSLPEQLRSVQKVLAPIDFDLISINEIQYDLPGVPGPDFETDGQNMTSFMKFLRPELIWNISFFPANTGMKAKKKSSDLFSSSQDPGSRSLADPVNYGLFPAQYSSGLASRYPILKKVVIDKLQWKEFNERLDLRKYRAADKSELPATMELFDKNLVDTTIKIGKEEVHIITLHTVPAYHFGNKLTPNYQRNADQLAFLEWYLDSSVSKKKKALTMRMKKLGIEPLKSSDHFIAMGDWNTDLYATNPGSKVLRRLFKSLKANIKKQVTHESKGFKEKPFMMQLDYIIHSPSLRTISHSVLRATPNLKKQRCAVKMAQLNDSSDDQVMVKVDRPQKKKLCYKLVSKEYAAQKKASDHFALYSQIVFTK